MVNPLVYIKRKIKSFKRKCNWNAKTTRLANYFTEYCDRTSIHGFKYVGEQARSHTERCWWFVTVIILTFICFVYIVQAYLKWKQSPVIVSLQSQQMPIWKIPFPTVTICPQTKFVQSLFPFNAMLSNGFADLNETLRLELEYASLICSFNDTEQTSLYYVNESALHFFDKVKPKFLRNCTWNGKQERCHKLFKPILTDEGVCFSFNAINRDELFSDDIIYFDDYQKTQDSKDNQFGRIAFDEQYPRKARLAGAQSGLEVTLVGKEEDLSYNCGNSLQGYKVLLHNSDELPEMKRNFFLLPLNYVLNAAVTPNVMSTSNKLKMYTPMERECYFPDEQNIGYFKVYNEKNCQFSLLSKQIYELCNCVAFYMPRKKGSKICGPSASSCIQEAKEKYMNLTVDAEVFQTERDYTFWGTVFLIVDWIFQEGKLHNPPEYDECLPSCTTTTYSTEISQSIWHWKRKIVKNTNLKKTNPRSKLEIYFKDTQFTASKRNEIYGSLDLLASCGGLLGLFTGFSIISLIEIVYFLTFRWMLR